MHYLIKFRQTFRTGLAGTIASMIYFYSYQSHSIWVVVGAILISQIPEKNTALEMIYGVLDRVIGTVIGISLGIIGYQLIFMSITDNNNELIFFIIFVIFCLSDAIIQIVPSLSTVTISATIVMLIGTQTDSVIHVATQRSEEILIGALVGVIVSIIIPPRKKVNKKN